MTTTTTPNLYDESVRRLADGFSSEFAEFCAGHEMMHDLMMDLASEFVQTNIPIVSEDSQTDLAAELLMSVTVTKV
jgi:hypothetical protein